MQGNGPTAYTDLSGVYGVDQSTSDSLRERQGGRMITNQYNVLPETPNCTIPACYRAGKQHKSRFFKTVSLRSKPTLKLTYFNR